MLRREFFRTPLLAVGATLPLASVHGEGTAVYDVRRFGAHPDGKTLCTVALQRAVDAAYRAGGGLVYVSPGVYLTGNVELKSRVCLYLEAGSVLLGSTRIEDYTEQAGAVSGADANGRHLLYARKAEDVSLCGMGRIDGQGEHFWKRVNRRPIAPEDLWKDVITYDYAPADGNKRPSPMIEFAECRNVHVSLLTIQNSAGWTLRLVACDSVTVQGIKLRNPIYGVNTDGIDVTASRNVVITGCDIRTGDDAICLKSENPYSDLSLTKNVVVSNCVITTSCNGFKIGTGTQGRFENIVFTNSVIYNDATSPLNARVIGGVCVEMVDGGIIDGVTVSDVRMANVRTPVFVRLATRKRSGATALSNVSIRGIDASGALLTSSITGLPETRVADVTISDCSFRTTEDSRGAQIVPELPSDYPEPRMFGRLPAYGLYVRHTDRLRVRNVEFISSVTTERPAVICDDVEDAILDGIEATPSSVSPLIQVQDARKLFLTRTRLKEPGHTLLLTSGTCQQIQVAGNALMDQQREIVSKRAGDR
ncbi:glycoside hydrolase family 28 protein [Terriglobus albidus]|uniref:Glycoside hydrolase family 28 protein n=1 Tax=Terriglobus albidus TaxID=1592106 RepID=A0A5B9E6T9_9BACT|nr:glycosyl hydrolase family 28 protein [Terriglobus albidus]QEE27992.1 glycoside hydrolase family 28 protein [Terriglobus albidus]